MSNVSEFGLRRAGIVRSKSSRVGDNRYPDIDLEEAWRWIRYAERLGAIAYCIAQKGGTPGLYRLQWIQLYVW
jgi:hypothetical protein